MNARPFSFPKGKLSGILSLAVLLMHGIHAATPEKQFSGKAEVSGLGLVAFPPGQWSLEFNKMQPAPNELKRPDYFVFKKSGEVMHRLSFLRYSPEIDPSPIASLLDGLVETMGDGVPYEEGNQEEDNQSHGYTLRIFPTDASDARQIEFSFISTRKTTSASWLCHATLYSKEGYVFVIVLASPQVTSPEDLLEVKISSRLATSR